jgi:hypothetical protein
VFDCLNMGSTFLDVVLRTRRLLSRGAREAAHRPPSTPASAA